MREILGPDLAILSFTSISRTSLGNPTNVNSCAKNKKTLICESVRMGLISYKKNVPYSIALPHGPMLDQLYFQELGFFYFDRDVVSSAMRFVD